MNVELEFLAHDQLARVRTAMSVEPELEASSIAVSMVGRNVFLQGYVSDYGHRVKATAIAAMIAGPENVHDRLRDVEEVAFTSLVLELSLPEGRAH
ncbi:BON domain-containing protein [Rhizobium sp. BK176]|uniref:BON domain-containing protein n=1 Tax=Rhizobium sp. BK176 TaxID=2587071 RepID=UPI00216A1D9E|nr:BON domain-containing protein [Rhizobium sp. BK176]MCS4096166.1 hypothetical protein [Rhizobium sp. BK176]